MTKLTLSAHWQELITKNVRQNIARWPTPKVADNSPHLIYSCRRWKLLREESKVIISFILFGTATTSPSSRMIKTWDQSCIIVKWVILFYFEHFVHKHGVLSGGLCPRLQVFVAQEPSVNTKMCFNHQSSNSVAKSVDWFASIRIFNGYSVPCLVPPRPILTLPVLARPILARPIGARPILPRPILAHSILARPILAPPILAHPRLARYIPSVLYRPSYAGPYYTCPSYTGLSIC